MKPVRAALLVTAIAAAASAHGQTTLSTSTSWWTYLADYDGTPGSTRVDMAFFDRGPISSLPVVAIVGIKYESTLPSRLPSLQELQRVNDLAEKVLTAVVPPSFAYAGTFTHNGLQEHYVYVQDIAGMEAASRAALKANCPSCELTFRSKVDPEWNTYRQFLYPSREVMEYYKYKPAARPT